jgi:hypothetical protein
MQSRLLNASWLQTLANFNIFFTIRGQSRLLNASWLQTLADFNIFFYKGSSSLWIWNRCPIKINRQVYNFEMKLFRLDLVHVLVDTFRIISYSSEVVYSSWDIGS